jgi:LPS-assembly protein
MSPTKSDKTGASLRACNGIEYESCCWRAAMVHAYERDQVTATNGGHSVKLQVELKGLGVLGRGASSIMERLLEGYELSEARY